MVFMGGVSQRVDLHSSFIWEESLGGVHGRCLTKSGSSFFFHMGGVSRWCSWEVSHKEWIFILLSYGRGL